MNRIKDLLDAMADLKQLAARVEALARTMQTGSGNSAGIEQSGRENSTKEGAYLKEGAYIKEGANFKDGSQDERDVTIEKVRSVLAEKSRAGKQDCVRSLIAKYGARKLTEIDPACYIELLADAKAL